MAFIADYDECGRRLFDGMSEAKPRRERNATRIATRYTSEIERDHTETARLHNKVGGFEGFFRVDATQPQEMRQMHASIRR